MAESIVKLIVDATQGVRSLGRFKKATGEAAKKTDQLIKLLKAQSSAALKVKAATESAQGGYTKLSQVQGVLSARVLKTERAISAQISTLRELRAGLKLNGPAYKRVTEEIERLEKSFERSTTKAEKFRSKLGGLKGAIVSLGVAALTKRMIGQAASFQQTQIRLKALSAEYGEFGKIQQLVKDNAKTFNLSQAEAASQFSDIYARLRPLGKTLEEVQTVYKGFNATAIASGTGAAAASGAFLQLSQALGSGRLQGDEFRSVSEQIPGILGLVADEMGVAVSELKKLGSEGKITSDILINALAKGFEKNKDKIQQILAESPAAKFKEFSNATSELSNAIGTELLPVVTPAVQGLTKLLKAAGDLPGPIKTAGAALIGFSAVVLALASPVSALLKGIAAFAPAAAGATSAAKLLAGAMVILKGAMLALPWVAAAAAVGGLIALTVNYYKEQSDLNSLLNGSEKEISKYETAIKKTNDKLAEAKSKLNDMKGAGVSNARAIRSQKRRVDELRSELEGVKGVYTAKVQVLIDIQEASRDIAGIDYKPDGPGGRLVPIDPPETVTQERERKAQELKDRLVSSGGSSTGSTAKAPQDISKEMQALLLKEQELRFSNDELAQSKIKKEIEVQRILESQLQPREKNIALIKAQNDELFRTSSIFSENFKKAAEADDQIKKTAINAVKAAISQAAEIDAQIEAQGEKMKDVYKGIGDSIQNGVVDALTAAVDGTKSLAEVASATLKDIGNMFIKLGINQLFNSLGSGGGFLGQLFGSAKGNIIAQNKIVPFAKGGIVGEPTIFPLANGTGLMGEAGPEAIMPLKRSPSGRLGVEVASTREQLNNQQAVASTREQLDRQRAVASTREQLNNQQAKAMQPLDIRYESTVINNVEYVTAEQHRKGMAQAAERGRAMTLTTLQNSPRTRSRVGI
jgi:tape measure domain-containing protein